MPIALPRQLVPRWFTIWFFASCGLFLVGGIANVASGAPQEGINLWGAAIGVMAMVLVMVLAWRRVGTLRSLLDRLEWPLWVKFVVIGWLFAQLDEVVNFPFNPLAPGVTLLEDIVLTTPMYVLGHLGWYWIQRKYRFSLTEALVIGGLTLGLFEVFSGGVGPAALLVLLVLPFLIMIHGVHMLMPPMLLEESLSRLERRDTRWKYALGVVVPSAGVLLGIGIAYWMQVPVHYLLGA